GASFPGTQSHAPRPSATHVIVTVEILKTLQVENFTVSRRAGRPDPAYRQSFYFHRIVFAFVGERPRAPVHTDSKSEATGAQLQSCIWSARMMFSRLSEARHCSDNKKKNA